MSYDSDQTAEYTGMYGSEQQPRDRERIVCKEENQLNDGTASAQTDVQPFEAQ